MDIFNLTYDQVETVGKPSMVYKYRTWNSGKPHEDNVLLKKELFFARPETFEDQLECRNIAKYQLLKSEEIERWLDIKFRKHFPEFTESAILDLVTSALKDNKFKDKNWMIQYYDQEWTKYNKLTGILSLTDNPLNLELWRKYALNHSGICYGFDTNILLVSLKVRTSGYVQYVENLPWVSPFDDDVMQLIKRVYYKTMGWKFEDEYRFRTFGSGPQAHIYPSSALKAVILGSNFDMLQVPRIVEAVNQVGTHVQLYKSVLYNGTIKLVKLFQHS